MPTVKTKEFCARASLSLLIVALIVGIFLPLVGCKTGPPPIRPEPLDLVIQPAGQAANLTIHVYVVPMNSKSQSLFDKLYREGQVDECLKDLSSKASTSTDFKSFQLGKEAWTLPLNDPNWNVWLKQRQADSLVVIADLPRNFGGAGPPDKRREMVPLDRAGWKHLKPRTIHVEIQQGYVKLLDNPRF